MSTHLRGRMATEPPHSGGVQPSGTGYRPDSGEDVKGLFEMFKYSKLAAVALIAIAASLANAAGIEVTAGDEAELADLLVAAAGTAGGAPAPAPRRGGRSRRK